MTVVIVNRAGSTRRGQERAPLDTFYYHIDKSRVGLRWQGVVRLQRRVNVTLDKLRSVLHEAASRGPRRGQRRASSLLKRGGHHVRNICMAAAYLLPRWVKWPHVGKNVTLFSYMVMQHAAHLEIYPLGGTWLVQERNRGGGRNDAYTVLWELRDPLLPASPRTDRGDRREIVSLLDIFVPLASNTLPDT